MKKFDFNSFVQEQFEQFQDTFTLEEVKDILYLGEDVYTRDSPNSTGKTLVLDFLAFKGKKDDGKPFNYSQELNKGLSIWITKNSNLKGKSSIFKIIKFALTGSNSIKDDVNRWIEEILLCFTIGVHHYTVHITNKKRGLASKLYNSKISVWEDLEQLAKSPIFETNNEKDFEYEIQEFFFQQFSYYSLRWTQKHPKKEKLDLIEVPASWNTYFKSIYLESKDYGALFYGGSLSHQGQKVFQTLMGLDLTFAINQLTIKQDGLKNENAKEKLKSQSFQSHNDKKKEELKEEISKIEKQIDDLNKKPVLAIDQEIVGLQDQYTKLISRYNQISKLENDCRELSKNINKVESEIEQKRKLYFSIQNRIDSINKRTLELNEHIEIGVFLSDLEVKNCPSCHHSINEEKRKNNLSAHQCPLCSDGIIESEDVDKESYEEKIKQLQGELFQVEQQKKSVEDEGKVIKNELGTLKNTLKDKENELQKADNNNLLLQIQSIQSQINIKLAQNPMNNSQREELIIKKAVLEYQLKEIENNSTQTKSLSNYEREISLLQNAIEALKKQRYEIGNNIILRLQYLMLKEVHSFGITSITGIRITENFDVKYTQGGEEISFEKISEGEQLRAKLAFYLSLIQLDIESAMGKHTRFLMIDSPGKEEAGNIYMDGLISVLQDIEKRYGDELQILIATADSRFENTLKNQFVYQEDTFIF
jgi:DNA repair exonuclease SbcCD ATPase subunit